MRLRLNLFPVSLLLLCLHTNAERNPLLSSDLSRATNNGSTISDYLRYDLDANNNQMTVTESSGEIIIRSSTIPDPSNRDAADIREDNAVAFPYIPNPAGNEMIHIRLEFSQERACPNYTVTGVQCLNHLTLNVYEADANTDTRALIANGTTPLATYNLTSPTSSISSPIAFNKYPEFPATTAGFRIVLLDGGSEFTVKLFTITSYYCKWNTPEHQLPVMCDDTNALKSENRTVNCTCGLNARRADDQLPSTQSCIFYPSPQNAGFSELINPCECAEAFELQTTQSGSYECVLKTNGTAPESTTLDIDTTPTSPEPTTESSESSSTSAPESPTTPKKCTPEAGDGKDGKCDGSGSTVVTASFLCLFMVLVAAVV